MMPFVEFVNAASGTVLAAVVNSAGPALLIALCAWLVMRKARGMNAGTRHLLWWAVAAALIALPALRIAPISKVFERSVVATPAINQAVEAVAATPVSTPPVQAAQPVTELQSPVQVDAGYLPLLIAILWAAVCIAQLARVAYSYMYLRLLKRTATPAARQLRLEFDEWVLSCRVGRDVRLLLSDAVASPIAVGFRRPAVIIPKAMPEQLSAKDLEHVLLHELAHLARRDDWTNLIARLISGVLVFHPLVLWILRRIDNEREIACDDWVVAATGAAQPYAATLARLFEFRIARQREMLATGIGGRRSRFTERIERLVQSGRSFQPQTSMKRVAACATLLLILAAAGTQVPEWIALAQTDPVPVPPPAPGAEPVRAPEPPRPAGAPHATTAEFAPVPAHPPAPAQPMHPALAPHADIAVLAPPPHPPAPAVRTLRPAMAPHGAMAVLAPPHPPQPAQAASGESFLKALADAGYRDLSVDQIIELKVHGVDPAWIKGMSQAGWKLTPKEMVDLRVHGIRPEYVTEIHALGYGPYTPKQMIQFFVHGAKPEFFRALKEAGFGNATPDEIVKARVHGLNSANLQEAKKYGSSLSLDKIVRLKMAGVI